MNKNERVQVVEHLIDTFERLSLAVEALKSMTDAEGDVVEKLDTLRDGLGEFKKAIDEIVAQAKVAQLKIITDSRIDTDG